MEKTISNARSFFGLPWPQRLGLAVLLSMALAGGGCRGTAAPDVAAFSFPSWSHLSSADGDLPVPGLSDQQTGSLVADLDGDGVDEFVIVARVTGPSVAWYRRTAKGWDRYIIDSDFLRIEAGGACWDIDGDGDLDLVFGGDAGSNQIWWWENPAPDFDPGKNWTRRLIKNSGATKHHDQAFGDFDGDGRAELASWNQRDRVLLLFEIPEDPRDADAWPSRVIYRWEEGPEHEGLVAADVNQDGKLDLVGGGRWFEYAGDGRFTAHVIDDAYRFSRAAAGQLVGGGWLEIVFQPGDRDGPLRWFEYKDGRWISHRLLDADVIHGHSLAVADIDGDGHLDIFSAEMGQWGGKPTVNPVPKMRIFYGDGAGGFRLQLVSEGFGNHESRVADLDGDGDLDILGKPYNWRAPRIDVWLQGPPQTGPLGRWRRHVIDYEKPWRAVYVLAGDLDGDGWKDVVTGGWWYRNPGAAGGKWERRDLGEPLHNVAVLYDFDKDGDLDVLGTEGRGSEANSSFVWARNDGQGRFTILGNIPKGEGDFLQGVEGGGFRKGVVEVALSWHKPGHGLQMLAVPPQPSREQWSWRRIHPKSQDEELTAGDIDGDGDNDLLLGTWWLENTGGPEWSALHELYPSAGKPDRNCLADINGDGKLDAVVGYESMRAPAKLAWYEQGGDPRALWQEHVIATLVGPMSLDCADMDADGDIDVVLGQHNLRDPPSSRLFVYENQDAGRRWSPHLVWTGDEHHDGSQTVDIDNDGDLDIISIGWTHSRVLLYENLRISDGR